MVYPWFSFESKIFCLLGQTVSEAPMLWLTTEFCEYDSRAGNLSHKYSCSGFVYRDFDLTTIESGQYK